MRDLNFSGQWRIKLYSVEMSVPRQSAHRLLLLMIVALIATTSCTRLFYASMKKLGKEKREILVSRIMDAKEAQEDASKQFKTALEAFQAMTNFKGGELEKSYNKLNGVLEDAQGRAKKVSGRIAGIEKVSKDLFKEWSGEIDTMSDGPLKRDSRALLRTTQQRNSDLVEQMHASEEKMQPVLQKFSDQVVYLKHNLNARAVGALKTELASINGDVESLLKDIEASNQAADKAIAGLDAAVEKE
jgi:hypothetical protein